MKKKSISIGIGIMSLLMIFIILCMVTLAVLSYQNAQQSESLALREKESLTKYYEAQQKASLLYAQVLDQEGKSLEEIQANLQASVSPNVIISLENEILTLTIQNYKDDDFHIQIDEQLQLRYWGQGEVQ